MRAITSRLKRWHKEHYLFIPLYVYLPVIHFFAVSGAAKIGLKTAGLAFLAGVFLWSLTEYLLHRFGFHHVAKTALGKKIVLYCHGYHHQAPAETRRAVMIMSLPSATILLLGFHLVLPSAWAGLLFGGLLSGYLAYDGVHYALHHWSFQNRVGKFLKAYHLRHHGREHDKAFGVTSPFWDMIFGTRPASL